MGMFMRRRAGNARAIINLSDDDEPEEPKRTVQDLSSFASSTLRGQTVVELDEGYDPDWDTQVRKKKKEPIIDEGFDKSRSTTKHSGQARDKKIPSKRLGTIVFNGGPASLDYPQSALVVQNEGGAAPSTFSTTPEPGTPALMRSQEKTQLVSASPPLNSPVSASVEFQPVSENKSSSERNVDHNQSWHFSGDQTRTEVPRVALQSRFDRTLGYTVDDNKGTSLHCRGRMNSEELLPRERFEGDAGEPPASEGDGPQTLRVLLPRVLPSAAVAETLNSSGQGRYDRRVSETEETRNSLLTSPTARQSVEDMEHMTLDYYEGDTNDFCELATEPNSPSTSHSHFDRSFLASRGSVDWSDEDL